MIARPFGKSAGSVVVASDVVVAERVRLITYTCSIYHASRAGFIYECVHIYVVHTDDDHSSLQRRSRSVTYSRSRSWSTVGRRRRRCGPRLPDDEAAAAGAALGLAGEEGGGDGGAQAVADGEASGVEVVAEERRRIHGAARHLLVQHEHHAVDPRRRPGLS